MQLLQGYPGAGRNADRKGTCLIGYLGNFSNPNNVDRYRGYMTALREARLTCEDEYLCKYFLALLFDKGNIEQFFC